MTSLEVIVARSPRNAPYVGAVVDLRMDTDPDEAAQRIQDAAESLRAAGLALLLSPVPLEVRTKRRRWWRRKGNLK